MNSCGTLLLACHSSLVTRHFCFLLVTCHSSLVTKPNVAKNPKSPVVRGSIIVISAPSGSGKSTLIKRLMAASPNLSFSVSYTTRAPRATEKHGRDYFFISRKVFERMVFRNEFVEWADVFGHLYGTAHAFDHGPAEGGGLVVRVRLPSRRARAA